MTQDSPDAAIPPPKGILSGLCYWTIPGGGYRLMRDGRDRLRQWLEIRRRPYLRVNRELKNRHRGERCFILCNGPSIAKEDLQPLRHETCIAVTVFYHHPQYPLIAPRYHCVPNLDRPWIEEKVVTYLREMDQHIRDATLLIGENSRSVFQSYGIFSKRKVHLLHLERQGIPTRIDQLDMTGAFPQSTSGGAYALLIALHLGFREIYLLGTEQDETFRGARKYFFDRRKMIAFDQKPNVNENGEQVFHPHLVDVGAAAQQFREYVALAELARSANVRVVNLTSGGYVDAFPRARLEDVLTGKPA